MSVREPRVHTLTSRQFSPFRSVSVGLRESKVHTMNANHHHHSPDTRQTQTQEKSPDSATFHLHSLQNESTDTTTQRESKLLGINKRQRQRGSRQEYIAGEGEYIAFNHLNCCCWPLSLLEEECCSSFLASS